MATVILTEYTDPYCTWCWGSEPVLRHVKEAFGDQVELRFVLGGLVEHVNEFYDAKNDIGGAQFFEQVAEHWEEASRKHGMPVNGQVWLDMKNTFTSTWPACKAVEAAQLQDLEKGKRFLRRMREAAAAEQQHIHKVPVQKTLAVDTGVDPEKLVGSLEDGSAAAAFQEDRAECREYDVTGFPTFHAENQGTGEETVFRGYTSYSDMAEELQDVAGDGLERDEPDATPENIHGFVEEYGKVAVQEVAEVFNVSRQEADTLLTELCEAGMIDREQVGSAVFYRAPENKEG